MFLVRVAQITVFISLCVFVHVSVCVCVCVHKYSIACPALHGLAVAVGTWYFCKIKGIYSIYKHIFTQISLLIRHYHKQDYYSWRDPRDGEGC